jgi:hypothetical protein
MTGISLHNVTKVETNLKHYPADGNSLEFWRLKITVSHDGHETGLDLFADTRVELILPGEKHEPEEIAPETSDEFFADSPCVVHAV